jgi:hypothetical protein
VLASISEQIKKKVISRDAGSRPKMRKWLSACEHKRANQKRSSPEMREADQKCGSGSVLASISEQIKKRSSPEMREADQKCGSGSVVEHLLAKERVASSNLVFRSILHLTLAPPSLRGSSFFVSHGLSSVLGI